MLAEHVVGGEATGVRRRLGVIGDAEIGPTPLLRRLSQSCDGGLSIGITRVAMEDAAQVAQFDELGQFTRRGGRDLAAVLAQLQRNPRQAGGAVERFLVFVPHDASPRIDEPARLDAESAVPKSSEYGVAVLRGPGRTPERERERVVRDAMQLHASTADQAKGHRASAGCDDLFHSGSLPDRISHLSGITRAPRDKVDLADNVRCSPQRAGDVHPLHARESRDRPPKSLRFRVGVEVHDLSRRLPERGDAAQDLVGRFRAEAGKRGEPPIPRRRLELGDAGNAEPLVNPMNPREAKSGDSHHFDESRRRRLPQGREVRGLTRLHEVGEDRKRLGSDSRQPGDVARPYHGCDVVFLELADGARGLGERA